MAPWSTAFESRVVAAIKRLSNQGHTSELFELYEDPAPRGGPGSLIPTHPILSSSQIIGEPLASTAPAIGHAADDGTVLRFGNAFDPPTQALKLAPILSVGDNRAWIAVDGGLTPDATTDIPWAFKAPSIGFVDAWADGDQPITNANGHTYKAQFWWGDPTPASGGELLPSHPSVPVWDPATGILFFAGGDPYASIITPGASLWFTGYLYTGNSVKDVLDNAGITSGQDWNRVSGCVAAGTTGIGIKNNTVTFDITPAAGNVDAAMVYQNGVLLMPGPDYMFTGPKLGVIFSQQRRLLRADDEIQIVYPLP
jgi:hypothetical protein